MIRQNSGYLSLIEILKTGTFSVCFGNHIEKHITKFGAHPFPLGNFHIEGNIIFLIDGFAGDIVKGIIGINKIGVGTDREGNARFRAEIAQ